MIVRKNTKKIKTQEKKKIQIKHYLALIAVTDETAPAGDIFKVKLIYTIRPPQ